MFRYFNFRLIMILMPCPRLYMIENSRDENYVHTLIISHAKEITFTSFRVDFFGMLRPKTKRTERISGNAVDKKNLHPGNSKFIFLIDSPDILSFFLSFFFFPFYLFICLMFFQIKNVYSDTHPFFQPVDPRLPFFFGLIDGRGKKSLPP